MQEPGLHYFPVIPFFMFLFILFLILLVGFIEIGVLKYAYQKIGIKSRYLFLLLALSLGGSYINIPIAKIPAAHESFPRVVSHYGMQHVVPQLQDRNFTIVAVNVGGALIPTLLSIYLWIKNRLFFRGLLGVAIVSVIIHLWAEPIRGVGIAVPTFAPGLIAAAIGLVLSRSSAPPLAYISGTIGTLIGADLLNLVNINQLDAPIASIGGAGTFDGIFITGIIAALIA